MAAPIIDFHVHFNDPEVYKRGSAHNVMSGFGTRPMPPAQPSDGWRFQIQEKVKDPALQVADMDKFGIGMHVTSLIGVSVTKQICAGIRFSPLIAILPPAASRWIFCWPK